MHPAFIHRTERSTHPITVRMMWTEFKRIASTALKMIGTDVPFPDKRVILYFPLAVKYGKIGKVILCSNIL